MQIYNNCNDKRLRIWTKICKGYTDFLNPYLQVTSSPLANNHYPYLLQIPDLEILFYWLLGVLKKLLLPDNLYSSFCLNDLHPVQRDESE